MKKKNITKPTDVFFNFETAEDKTLRTRNTLPEIMEFIKKGELTIDKLEMVKRGEYNFSSLYKDLEDIAGLGEAAALIASAACGSRERLDEKSMPIYAIVNTMIRRLKKIRKNIVIENELESRCA